MSRRLTVVLIVMSCLLVGLQAPLAWGQAGSQGTVSVTVLDPSGGVIPEAQLKLVDIATNTTREATTQDSGNYSFINLNIGSYKLTISKGGFNTQAYAVEVQAARTTDLKAVLKVGATSQTVEVIGSAAPLIETSSSATSITIDTKQIEDLPLAGRDITALSKLAAGYNGTWNGLPTMAQGNNIDGVIGSAGRWKYNSGGGATAALSPRLENIAEMTVQTDQLDLNQGFGTSNMQINFVTRRGTNQLHGRIYEDHRNSALNAKYWPSSNSTKPGLILNEFGASVGGAAIKDKLFFFGSFSMSKRPGSLVATDLFMTSAAQNGNFAYSGGTVNLFNIAQAYNAAHPGTNLPIVVNNAIGQELSAINTGVKQGSLRPDLSNSPNLMGLQWNQSNPNTYYYPTFRVDYNASQSVRLNLAYNQTKWSAPTADQGFWPGDGRQSGSKTNAASAAFGLEWTIKPTLINQFRGGYLYNATWYGQGGSSAYFNPGAQFVNWNYSGVDSVQWDYLGWMSGQQYRLRNSRSQPLFTISDTMSWMKGAHSFSFGFSGYREQDHYWDPAEGYPVINLGLAEGDPALEAFTAAALPGASSSELAEAKQMYAILAGRISSVTGRIAYDAQKSGYTPGVRGATLNELQKAWGLFFQDSYKMKSNLTVNYGLRWDFTGDNHDLTNAYHSATPANVFGPSGVWNLFNPGVLNGVANPILQAQAHTYKPWNVSPQPAIGLAWSPRSSGGLLGKLLGNDSTVIRAGYSLRRFTEPQQYFWNAASDYGAFFYQNFNLNANNTGQTGTFAPGSLALGQSAPFPNYVYSPTQFVKSEPQSDFTFLGGTGVNGMNPNIRQPYTQSWNIGIQRQLSPSRALEVRYNGNHTIHQWMFRNINEVNIIENGFLQEFKNAQRNLAIYKQQNPLCGQGSNAPCNFSNTGLPGQVVLPIMTAAFGPSGAGFTGAKFVNNLQNGQAGAMATTLTGVDYFCNLVGDSFSPCKNQGGFTGPGAGYPINFFQANPYASGSDVGYMTDSAFSNYHSLQVELRQKQWHGVQFTANYTWSHTLGVAEALDWEARVKQFTNRNLNLNYGPTNFDIRHVINVNASYDLPIGRGKQWLNQGGIMDKIAGGWAVSTIFKFKTGSPFRLTGADPNDPGSYSTLNQMADPGVVLNGITAADLQKHVGVWVLPSGAVKVIDPTWLAQVKANGSLSTNTTPGTIGQIIYLHGPHQTFDDIAVTKSVSITERVKFKFQTELLNAFNHPVFQPGGGGYQSVGSFGQGGYVNNGWMGEISSRRIEFRANIEF